MKQGQLKSLVRYLVKEALNELDSMMQPDMMDPTMAALSAQPESPGERMKREREMRQQQQKQVKSIDKTLKLKGDEHRAMDKQFKMMKHGLEHQRNALKRPVSSTGI